MASALFGAPHRLIRRCSPSSRGSGQAWVRDPVLVFYPGARGSRGPQRLCSLNPDTSAAAPSSWRSRETTRRDTVRAARVRRVDDQTDLRDFQDRAGGDCPGGDISPQRDHELARDRHNANSARALPCAEMLPIPLGERAERLPADPIPRQLNADRLQPLIAGATDPLLSRYLPAVVGRRRKAQESSDLAPIAKRAPDQALVEQHRRARRRDA